MPKAVYWTDTHVKATNPQSRKGDYFGQILAKLRWVIEYINRHQAMAFDGGDLFDRAVQSAAEIFAVYEIYKKCKPIIYTVAGNHPIRGNVEAWKPKSGLYLLEKILSNFKILDAFAANITDGEVTFRLHHMDLVKKPVIWNHVLWEDYDAEGADVVLVSHYHPQQGIWQREDGVWFVSPGALSRGSLGEDNLDRIPAIAVIDYSPMPGKINDIKLVDVPCLPGEEVLETSNVLRVVDIQRDLERYQTSVNELRRLEEEDEEAIVAPIEILKTIASSHNIGPLVLNYCLEVMKEMEA